MNVLLNFALIVLARIVDVSLGTMRVSFIARGRKALAAACGFTEIFIWIAVVSGVLRGDVHVLSYVAYALGFTLGTFVGMSIEERIAVGWSLVRVISARPVAEFVQKLSAAGFGVTQQDAQGARGPVQVLVILMPRRRLVDFRPLLGEFDPNAFYTIEDVRHARDVPPAYATAATAAGKVHMPV